MLGPTILKYFAILDKKDPPKDRELYLIHLAIIKGYTPRGPERGCNLVHLPCNPSVIFCNLCNVYCLFCQCKSVIFSNLLRDCIAQAQLSEQP